MEENTFWLRLWQSVVAGICVLVATLAGCTSYKVSQAAELIQKGADPIKVGCALDVGDNNDYRCLLVTTKPDTLAEIAAQLK